MSKGPIKIAAVGLGWVTRHRHIPAIQHHPDLELVGVIDTDYEKAKACAHELNLPHFDNHEDFRAIKWLYDVDAITIGAPPASHKKITLSALQNGKHVLTEKPFAMSIAEGEEMAAAAKNAGKTLSVVHNFQFSRAAKKLKQDISKGKLGTIKRIAAVQQGNPDRRLPSWYETLPLGLFYDESPHFFYLLDELTEHTLSLENAHIVKGEANTPRLIQLLYNSKGNVPVTIDCQFDSAISEWHIMVSGDKAVGMIDLFRDIYIRLPNDGSHSAWDILYTSMSTFTQHFIQHIPNGLALACGFLDYGNNEIMDRFASSIKTGLEDGKIGFTQALNVLKLQHNVISKVQGTLNT